MFSTVPIFINLFNSTGRVEIRSPSVTLHLFWVEDLNLNLVKLLEVIKIRCPTLNQPTHVSENDLWTYGRKSDGARSLVGKGYPSSGEVEVSPPPPHICTCQLASLRENLKLFVLHRHRKTRASHIKISFSRFPTRFASWQIDFWAGDTFNLPWWVKGHIRLLHSFF